MPRAIMQDKTIEHAKELSSLFLGLSILLMHLLRGNQQVFCVDMSPIVSGTS